MKAFLKKEQGQEIITKELQQLLIEIYAKSLRDLNAVMDSCQQTLNSRSKPTLLHNFLINEAKIYFADMENVSITEKYNSIIVVITKNKESVAGRFKKLNKKGLTSNAVTKRNQNILSQQYEMAFEDMPRPTFVDIGYSINETWTNFESVKILCKVNNNPLWEIGLFDTDDSKIKSIILDPETAIEQTKIKRAKAKKTGTNG